MDLTIIRDRQALANYFQQNIPLHCYSLGDLDDFYWPHATYIGRDTPRGLFDISVLYQGEDVPVLLSFTQPPSKMDQAYFSQLNPLLPDCFYAHLSPGLENYFSGTHRIEGQGEHYKMDLQNRNPDQQESRDKVHRLTERDLPEMLSMFKNSYPDNAFNPRMIYTKQYYGYRESGKLVCIGGVHIYSEMFRVAALGNIATHPEYRNRGLARLTTATLISSLLDTVDFIGLNVKAANSLAVNLYQSLGFKITEEYGEFSLKKLEKPHFPPKNR